MIKDAYLVEIAKGMNSESYVTPSHLLISTDELTPDATTQVISGEIGTRETTSNSRDGSTMTLEVTRSSASVIDTVNGDDINTVGLSSALTSGTTLTQDTVTGILQTTDFDVQFIYNITPRRS